MNNKIKIIFCDIDSTIFIHPERVFDIDSIKALKRAQHNGVKVVLCTARSYHSMKDLGILDIFTPDGLVTGNGGTVFYNNELIYSDYFDKSFLKKIVRLCRKYHFNAEFIREKECFLINHYDEYPDLFYPSFMQKKPVHKLYLNQKITRIALIGPDNHDEEIISLLPKPLYWYRFLPYGVDLTPCESLKSRGVNKILSYLNINKEEAMAIGDDVQDISMFEAVEYSVCMENGNIEAKKFAKYRTKDIRKSGVKYILQKLEII